MVGVLADTHIPDRVAGLHPDLISVFRQRQVDQILHAGDICVPETLAELEKVAPVTAVRGNRDWAFPELPWKQTLHLAGTPVALLHGHGSLKNYIWDKFMFILHGYRIQRYLNLAARLAPEARVIVFGHTHRPANLWLNGHLFFNPGSAAFYPPEGGKPSIGILTFWLDGRVEGELIPLRRIEIRNRQWIHSKIGESIS